MNLRLDWCTYEAARYACLHWHYSRSMPACKTVKIGVWEDESFRGVVIFSLGACLNIAKPYGLTQNECCELTRVALRGHKTPVSRIISIALKMLKKQSPGLRLVISYADENQDHLGKIYQAGNWIYVGECSTERGIKIHGKLRHRRTLNKRYGTTDIKYLRQNIDPHAKTIKGKPKHKYLMPLGPKIKKEIESLGIPYPKCVRSIVGDASAIQVEEGGSNPTLALHSDRSVEVAA